jgi:uncharacterized protein YbjT (DUF2867 family)
LEAAGSSDGSWWDRGHEVLAASPDTGVNTITGEGLAKALAGAQVVVDVTNPPSFEDKEATEFFQTSGRNLIAAEKPAHVRHHVALSVVGTDRLLDSGYFRGKMAQEELIKASPIAHTILHSTQFFEFIGRIAQSMTGPEQFRIDEIVRCVMQINHDTREVITDPHARYFGAELSNERLTPDEEEAIIAVTTFDDWLKRSNPTRPSDNSVGTAAA